MTNRLMFLLVVLATFFVSSASANENCYVFQALVGGPGASLLHAPQEAIQNINFLSSITHVKDGSKLRPEEAETAGDTEWCLPKNAVPDPAATAAFFSAERAWREAHLNKAHSQEATLPNGRGGVAKKSSTPPQQAPPSLKAPQLTPSQMAELVALRAKDQKSAAAILLKDHLLEIANSQISFAQRKIDSISRDAELFQGALHKTTRQLRIEMAIKSPLTPWLVALACLLFGTLGGFFLGRHLYRPQLGEAAADNSDQPSPETLRLPGSGKWKRVLTGSIQYKNRDRFHDPESNSVNFLRRAIAPFRKDYVRADRPILVPLGQSLPNSNGSKSAELPNVRGISEEPVDNKPEIHTSPYDDLLAKFDGPFAGEVEGMAQHPIPLISPTETQNTISV